MENIGQQAERFGADIRYQDVEKVELTGDVKKVYTADGAVHLAKTVITTTGFLGSGSTSGGEDRLSGYGVFLVRNLRWLLLRDKGNRSGRRWRLRAGGGTVPDDLRIQGCTWCTAAILSALPKSCRPACSTIRVEVVWDSAVSAVSRRAISVDYPDQYQGRF